ncbi:chemotaxis protein histidine kinase CheA [Pseudarthrobacter defluvii]|uniref:Chemotaxis protein histidine kinase CheA n=1 Tax=Pseudarthrobacter defluvii TaxID=410837 RepID=A0ABT9UHG4_9MICC|nr:chemotaxis protein histidine kinase CheA [Pseudarthrobacter defluvii]
MRAGAPAAVLLLLTGCSTQASLSVAARPATESATATPAAKPIADTPCTAIDARQVSGGSSYVCTKDESGRLVWLEAAVSKRVSDKLAAAAAAKAAADKAAAEQAAAAKAAAEKAAADKAAADKDAADKAAAEAAALQAAEAKAAQDAAAAKAAADAAARAAAPPAPAPQPVPGTNPGCDPNYSGCVPIASDVDCAGGSGNGPAYVRGPVQVIGRDIYGLDADHDGVGCE